MLISARVSASCLAHRRAFAPIGAHGLILSRIEYLISNRSSYPEPIIFFAYLIPKRKSYPATIAAISFSESLSSSRIVLFYLSGSEFNLTSEPCWGATDLRMARKRPGCRPRKAEQFCFARVRFGAARQRSCNGCTYAGRSSLEDTLRDAEPCWNVSVTGRAYVSLFTSRGHWNANGGGRAGRPHFSRGGPATA